MSTHSIDGLIYRSNNGTVTVPSSSAAVPADGTPLGQIWESVLDPIRLIVKSGVPDYSSIGAGRLYTHGPDGLAPNPDGQTDGGSLSPGAVLVTVPPGSTDADTAREVSEEIFALLDQHGVDDAMVEWSEAVVTML
ncbi:hypothetical protein DFP72DRAFT_815529 [Ephemerocybe angulata]|uniref:Uncharacterized protein n=1 Tax=Ephemerocybe angulata TaxID=980116 RepID=A0A8H6M2L1_9AGAR|nr:hypothetical protein DFP72DRAFT_819951 [Tulosesus angulatus]KAF6752150.1 hypothetical protein DFP72DRAFT_815529 [Tulosesus angulatus]